MVLFVRLVWGLGLMFCEFRMCRADALVFGF